MTCIMSRIRTINEYGILMQASMRVTWPSTVPPGGAVDFSFSNLFSPVAGDWVGVFAVGASDSASYGSWIYTNCSQSVLLAVSSYRCAVKMPTVSGQYELRITSNVVTALPST